MKYKMVNHTVLIASRIAKRSVHISASAAGQAYDGRQLHRFYVQSPLSTLNQGSLVRLAVDEAKHACKTLRLKEGDSLQICDGLGSVVVAELASIDKLGALVRTMSPVEQAVPRGWQWNVAVACGSLKGGRADWLVEKCTELGAVSLLPLLTHRSPVFGSGGGDEEPQQVKNRGTARDSAAGGRAGRMERVATAAMKQSLRLHAMTIEPPCNVPQLIERMQAVDAALVAYAGAPPLPIVLSTLDSVSSSDGGIRHGLLIVGPEGDFTPEEKEALVGAGALPCGLGTLRLRTETAAIALLASSSLAFSS